MLCGRVTNLLSAYMDRELTGVEMLQVRAHMESCAACRAEYEGLADVKSLLGGIPAARPRGDYLAGAMERFARDPQPSLKRTERLSVGFRWLRWRLTSQQTLARLGMGLTRWVPASAAGLACLTLALVATGIALRQPKDRDAVVARLSRVEAEEWRVRPWELGGHRVAERLVTWTSSQPSLPEGDEFFTLSTVSPAAGRNRSPSPEVRQAQEILHSRRPALFWTSE
jgi:anti-sigma factor RsiW